MANLPARFRKGSLSSRRSPSRRRRRITYTALALLICAVVVTAVVVTVHIKQRPTAYSPGEKHADITSKLARGIPEDAPMPQFEDVTAAAGLGDFTTFEGTRTSQLPEDMGSGAAWGDYDNDGDDDLFLVSLGGPLSMPAEKRSPCRLYENLGNGRFQQAKDFPDTRIIGMAAVWGDYNNDGWLDLFITGYNSLILYRNDRGSFVRESVLPDRKGFWAGANWGDFDNDRDLDLYVCGYVRYIESDARAARASQQYGQAVPYTINPSSYAPQENMLFRNNGDGTFTEVAKSLGVSNPEGRSLSALWHDFDGDGWQDLYVANDISDNVFFRNTHGTFEDISHAAWVADYRGAMGLAVGDWDRDGDDDLFVTHWIAQENALYDSLLTPLEERDTSSKPAGSPAVADQSRELRFMDLADRMGLGQIALQVIGWGTEFADFDGDGWLDLVVTNGSTLETEEEPKKLKPQKPFLFWNRRGEGFFNISPLSTSFYQPHVGRGLALSDYDNDGDLDILVVHHGEGVQLLRNDMQSGNWLKLRLRSLVDGKGKALGFGNGARVVCRIGAVEIRRSITGASYLSQSSHIVHIGLGTSETVDELEVHWPGGKIVRYGTLAANTMWELRENEQIPRRIGGSGAKKQQAPSTAPESADERARLVDFWAKQREAMNAMKIDQDIPRAVELFNGALALNPEHEDSLYYLGSCLALLGEHERALEKFKRLTSINAQSHRGHKQWGLVRALTAGSRVDLEEAEAALERAVEINPEETGALQILGEIDLLLGEYDRAKQRLEWVCRTNPRAVGGFFLRGYIAWERGDSAGARELLEKARTSLGEDWKPQGMTAEGDVRKTMFSQASPLSEFWENWYSSDSSTGFPAGSLEPGKIYSPLKTYLGKHPAR